MEIMKKLAFMTITALLLAACQSQQDPDEVEGMGMEEEPVVEQPPPATRRRYQPRERPKPEPPKETYQQEVIPGVSEGMLAEDGPGLTLMIDASTVDAFHQSLDLIASETSVSQYQSLRSSLQFIQRYDSDAWGGQEALLSVVNGLTGEEIIERAQDLRTR